MKRKSAIQLSIKTASAQAKQVVLLLVFFSPAFAKAQRQRVHSNSIWMGHFSSVRLSDRFSINSDVQVRSRDWTQKWSQQLVRSGLVYKATSHIGFAAGGAYFRHALYQGEQLQFRNEWRPWLEVLYDAKWKKFLVKQRLRLEERFLQKVINGQKAAGFDHITRLRYRIEWQVPLKGTAISSSLVNEFMVNPGHWGSEKFLDQNRTFAGFNFKIASSTTLQAQYMKIFYWRTNNVLEDHNAFRLTAYQQF